MQNDEATLQGHLSSFWGGQPAATGEDFGQQFTFSRPAEREIAIRGTRGEVFRKERNRRWVDSIKPKSEE